MSINDTGSGTFNSATGAFSSNSVSNFINNEFAGGLGLISQQFDQYIVSPLNAFGLGGFVFDVEGETEIRIESEITDNYVEDNTARQDNIAIRPIEIRLKRYVGELVYQENPNDFINIAQKVVQGLTIVDALLPKVSSTVDQIKQIATSNSLPSIADLSNTGANIWEMVQNLNPFNTKQAKAYGYLKALQQARILCGVQTPFEFLPNMVIKTLIAVQGENSKFISDFEITMKQIRQATTSFTTINTDSAEFTAGRNAAQQAGEENLGPVKGNSLLLNINNYIFGIAS